MKKAQPRPQGQPTSVGKAVRLPRYPLSRRLLNVLSLVDSLQTPNNLKTIPVILDASTLGGTFIVYADTGPYAISLDPTGSHPELSLLHEVGHFLEWQSIPKAEHGPRDFDSDPLFDEWIDVVLDSPNVQQIMELRDRHTDGSKTYQDLSYLLRPNELWTRAYSQYVSHQSGQTKAAVLWQQIAAENKAVKGGIIYQPYWPWGEFTLIQQAMQSLFDGLGWTQ